MSDLSVAHRAALAQLIENVPDRTLRQLALAVAGMPGDKARSLESMLAQAAIDRARRAEALTAIAPMFRPRPDGVAATTFPAPVLARLWKAASANQADILAYLDPDEYGEHDAYRVAAVCTRLYAAGAAAVRDQAEAVWPAGLASADRDTGLTALARVCDLGGLVHRALPSLKAWTGRPDGDQIAELRLLLRDAAAISPDGAQELLDILFAHLDDAPLILRLVTHSSSAAGRDSFLSGSELAVFVDRLIDAAEHRARSVETWQPGQPVEALQQSLTWIASFLTESDATVQIHPETAWGKRIRHVRLGASKTVGALLGRVQRAVTPALPMAKAQTAGRMTREMPQLDVPLDPSTTTAALDALDLVRILRAPASVFGCEAQRSGLMADLTTQVFNYADLALEEINGGQVADEALAIARVELATNFLDRLETVDQARTMRRRVAVAGHGPQAHSPRAA